jgi:hypothetical protein
MVLVIGHDSAVSVVDIASCSRSSVRQIDDFRYILSRHNLLNLRPQLVIGERPRMVHHHFAGAI